MKSWLASQHVAIIGSQRVTDLQKYVCEVQ